MANQLRPRAFCTDASTGIGNGFAWLCAKNGDDAADDLRTLGARVTSPIVDLSTIAGGDRLHDQKGDPAERGLRR